MSDGERNKRRGGYSHVAPVLLPVPQLDHHVVTAGENERLCGMDVDAANVVGVRIELGYLDDSTRAQPPFLQYCSCTHEF